MDGTVASPSLAIDTGAAIARIEAYLRDLVRQEGAQGVILGLSGGLDSSVLATLAVRALGPEAVRVVYLFDRTSDAAIASNARRMAEWLNLDLEVHDITAAMRARGVYRPVFIKLLQLSPAVASLSVATYRLICRENPFLSSLRAGGGERLRPWWGG